MFSRIWFTLLSLIILLLQLGHQALAQSIPSGINQRDSKNRRQGEWIIWFDDQFKPVNDKQEVYYYRVITYKDDQPSGTFTDYYRSGTKQSTGMLLQDRPEDIYDGLITWFREDGSKEQEAWYKRGEVTGDIRIFASDGTAITESFEVLNAKAQEARITGDLFKAKRFTDDALLIISVQYGTDNLYYATVLNNLALIQQELGEFQLAEANYQQAITIYVKEAGEQSELYANALNNLGTLHQSTGEFKKAETCLSTALTIREKVLGNSHPDYVASLNNLGNLYMDLGLYTKAISYLEQATALKAITSGKESTEYATGITNLGLAYVARGDYKRAEPLLNKSLEIKKRIHGINHPEYAACLNNLASLYDKSGNMDKAEKLYQEASGIYSKGLKRDEGYANTLNNLAIIHKKRGRYTDAETEYVECIKIKGGLFGKDHPSYTNSLNNLAELYKETRDFQKAEPLYLQVKLNWEKTLGKNHPLYATAVTNLGGLYSEQRAFSKSEPLLLEAKAIREKVLGKDHPDYIESLNNLAVLYDNEKLDNLAEPYYRESINKKMKEILNYFPSLSEEEKTKYYLSNRIYFQNFEEFCLKRLQDNPSMAGELYNLRLLTKAMIFNSVAKMRSVILLSKDQALISDFHQWQEKRDFMANVYRMSLEEKESNGINPSLLEEEINTLEKELSKRSELFVTSASRELYSWKDVRDKLTSGEGAIEIIQTHRRKSEVLKVYVILLVKPGMINQPEVIVLENGDELERKYIRYYRNAIAQKISDVNSYEQFWKPIAPKLTGLNRIYVSSDGVFNQINLNTLFNPEKNKFLMDELEIRTITSTKDLITSSRSAAKKIHDATLMGYPNYNSTNASSHENTDTGEIIKSLMPTIRNDSAQRFFDGDNIAELPGTKREIESIASILISEKINVNTYLLADASEEKIKSLRLPHVLHIATHGYFLEDVQKSTSTERGYAGFTGEVVFGNPLLRSGLLLSGARNAFSSSGYSTNGEDGLLTAYEAMNLNLDKTDLVVLSACETGLGVTLNGEGVYGLQRAFAVAGSRYTMMSLWKVDDQATQEFMTSFYQAWIKLLDINKALRIARYEVRSKYPEPYYWGAFVLSGL